MVTTHPYWVFFHLILQIPGNKMTAANLAVIFGPNLLQKERGGDLSPHAMCIEDSTAIISVTLVLIQNYRRLFTVQQDTFQLFLTGMRHQNRL